jgi:hypothetical protein
MWSKLNLSCAPFHHRRIRGSKRHIDVPAGEPVPAEEPVGTTAASFQFNCYLANSLAAPGFTPNEHDCCFYTKDAMVEGWLLMVLRYVGDSLGGVPYQSTSA